MLYFNLTRINETWNAYDKYGQYEMNLMKWANWTEACDTFATYLICRQ